MVSEEAKEAVEDAEKEWESIESIRGLNGANSNKPRVIAVVLVVMALVLWIIASLSGKKPVEDEVNNPTEPPVVEETPEPTPEPTEEPIEYPYITGMIDRDYVTITSSYVGNTGINYTGILVNNSQSRQFRFIVYDYMKIDQAGPYKGNLNYEGVEIFPNGADWNGEYETEPKGITNLDSPFGYDVVDVEIGTIEDEDGNMLWDARTADLTIGGTYVVEYEPSPLIINYMIDKTGLEDIYLVYHIRPVTSEELTEVERLRSEHSTYSSDLQLYSEKYENGEMSIASIFFDVVVNKELHWSDGELAEFRRWLADKYEAATEEEKAEYDDIVWRTGCVIGGWVPDENGEFVRNPRFDEDGNDLAFTDNEE